MLRRHYEADWKRRTENAIPSLFVDPPVLSPIPESRQSRLSRSSSSERSLPELVIERIRKAYDEPEEYYNELEKRMRKYYRKLFNIEAEYSSSNDFDESIYEYLNSANFENVTLEEGEIYHTDDLNSALLSPNYGDNINSARSIAKNNLRTQVDYKENLNPHSGTNEISAPNITERSDTLPLVEEADDNVTVHALIYEDNPRIVSPTLSNVFKKSRKAASNTKGAKDSHMRYDPYILEENLNSSNSEKRILETSYLNSKSSSNSNSGNCSPVLRLTRRQEIDVDMQYSDRLQEALPVTSESSHAKEEIPVPVAKMQIAITYTNELMTEKRSDKESVLKTDEKLCYTEKESAKDTDVVQRSSEEENDNNSHFKISDVETSDSADNKEGHESLEDFSDRGYLDRRGSAEATPQESPSDESIIPIEEFAEEGREHSIILDGIVHYDLSTIIEESMEAAKPQDEQAPDQPEVFSTEHERLEDDSNQSYIFWVDDAIFNREHSIILEHVADHFNAITVEENMETIVPENLGALDQQEALDTDTEDHALDVSGKELEINIQELAEGNVITCGSNNQNRCTAKSANEVFFENIQNILRRNSMEIEIEVMRSGNPGLLEDSLQQRNSPSESSEAELRFGNRRTNQHSFSEVQLEPFSPAQCTEYYSFQDVHSFLRTSTPKRPAVKRFSSEPLDDGAAKRKRFRDLVAKVKKDLSKTRERDVQTEGQQFKNAETQTDNDYADVEVQVGQREDNVPSNDVSTQTDIDLNRQRGNWAERSGRFYDFNFIVENINVGEFYIIL